MSAYTFKRGKIRAAETWTLDDTALSREGERITLSDITEVMFEQAVAGRQWVTVLKLAVADKTHTLQCNDTFAGQNRKQFLALAHDTVAHLNRTGSSASVRRGKGGAIGGWMMVIAGLALLLGSLYFIYGSFQNGHGAVNYVLGGGAALLGGALIKLGEPWKPLPDQTLGDLLLQITNLRVAADRG